MRSDEKGHRTRMCSRTRGKKKLGQDGNNLRGKEAGTSQEPSDTVVDSSDVKGLSCSAWPGFSASAPPDPSKEASLRTHRGEPHHYFPPANYNSSQLRFYLLHLLLM